MPRILLATLFGLAFFILYVVAVLALADRIGPMPWVIQLVYFALAGFLWVVPIRWLMLWAAGPSRGRAA